MYMRALFSSEERWEMVNQTSGQWIRNSWNDRDSNNRLIDKNISKTIAKFLYFINTFANSHIHK